LACLVESVLRRFVGFLETVFDAIRLVAGHFVARRGLLSYLSVAFASVPSCLDWFPAMKLGASACRG
jgi:hypothetical protein